MKPIITYIVKVIKDSKIYLSFPEIFKGFELITIKESLYDNLKSGEKVKFKMKSDLSTIVIKNGDTEEYLKENEYGFFEKEIILKAKPGEKINIGEYIERKKYYLCYYQYNVF